MTKDQQDRLLRYLASALLGLLVYLANDTRLRIDTLEKNQALIMVHLGIPPVAEIRRNTPIFGVNPAFGTPRREINEIKRAADTLKIVENSLDIGRYPPVESP